MNPLVGPPAALVVEATPTDVLCGEAVAIFATVKDATGQNVADETPVQFFTNFGGVLVPPLAHTYAGVAFVFLLTSETHSGPYEVVARTESSIKNVPPIMAMATVMASKTAPNRSAIDRMVDQLVRSRPDLARRTDTGITKTIMFTDVVDSTGLNSRLGDDAWAEILRDHNELVRAALAENAGVEVKHTGDGFLCSFERARDAWQCAVSIQTSLAEYRRRHPGEARGGLRVRIGIHTGDVVQYQGDINGLAVHLAARVAAKAGPSELLISSTVHDMLVGAVNVRTIGADDFVPKGFSTVIRVYSVDWRPEA